jgi:NRAMP (natural resistance-associated macrophage protein)-like metal ion transporter
MNAELPRDSPAGRFFARAGSARRFFRDLGPGLITGAADDDPSGIATYSSAGASFGFGLLWAAFFTIPLMSAVQLMCARIGLVTRRGLASILRRHYSASLLWFACLLLLVANVVNVAADLGGMAEAVELLSGLPSLWLIMPITALVLSLLVFGSYRIIVRIFKWLTLVLFAYVGAGLLARPNWVQALEATFLPRISFDRSYLTTLVAVLGTTISPYLFFWQAAHEVEEQKASEKKVGLRSKTVREDLRKARTDVLVGMSISNVIAYFIILTTGATLHAAGQRDIQTAREAAQALRPIAGELAEELFCLGLIGAGFLGVPILAGSAAYAVAEAGAWRRGIDKRPRIAKKFYAVIVVAMTGGMVIDYAGLNAIRMLFWAAVVNGVLAPPLIAIILLVSNNRSVMGEETNGRVLNFLGIATALVMSAAAIGMFFAR